MALMGLTGSVNVFYRELDVLLHPTLFRATSGSQQIGSSEAFRIARAAVPEPVNFLYAPDSVWPVWTGFFRRHGEIWNLTIDPGSGRILGIRDPGHSLIHIIYQLHSNLLLAPWWGEQIVGVLGILLLLMIGSGLWLWWPRRGLLAALLRLRTHPRQIFYADLHALAGIWTAIMLMVVATTGAAVVFPGLIRPVVRLASPVSPVPSPTIIAPPDKPFTIDSDRAVAVALKAEPTETLRYVMWPSESGQNGHAGAWQIGLRWQKGSTAELVTGSVWIDPWSGAILASRVPGRETGGEHAIDLLLWIHNGSALGWPGRIAVFLSGLSLPLLFVSGLLLWVRKRRIRQRAEQKRRNSLESRAGNNLHSL